MTNSQKKQSQKQKVKWLKDKRKKAKWNKPKGIKVKNESITEITSEECRFNGSFRIISKYYMHTCVCNIWLPLTRDLMRGGAQRAPPCWFFAHNSNSVGNIALKLSVPLRTSILRILWKQFVRGRPRSKVIEVKLRSCSTVFVKKSCFR